MPLTFHPHEIVLDRATQRDRVVHKADYVRLMNGDQSVYVRLGLIYLGGGDPISPDQAPSWFWDSYAALTPAARRAVGLELPSDKLHSIDQLPTDFVKTFKDLPLDLQEQLLADSAVQASRTVVEAPKISPPTSESSSEKSLVLDHPEAPRPTHWTCDECGEEFPLTKKGVHIGLHRRLAKAKARQE